MDNNQSRRDGPTDKSGQEWSDAVPTEVDPEDIFGHQAPYPQQQQLIRDGIKTIRRDGFLLAEGACGTGKTMGALTVAGTLIRDPQTPTTQALVLTSVKQQLAQFESDLKRINAELPDDIEPLTGTTLVGKTDVCPYAQEGVGQFSPDTVETRCQELREETTTLSGQSAAPTAAGRQTQVPGTGNDWETIDGEPAYPPTIPTTNAGEEYCPFYQGFLSGVKPQSAEATDSVLTADEAMRLGVEMGSCPHSILTSQATTSDIILANYYHAFDRQSLRITGELIDNSTVVICDEAHMMPSRVQDILSQTLNYWTLSAAVEEAARVVNVVQPDIVADQHATVVANDTLREHQPPKVVKQAVRESGYRLSALTGHYQTLQAVQREFHRLTSTQLRAEIPNWDANPEHGPSELHIPLRPPDEDTQDTLTKQLTHNGIPAEAWEAAEELGSLVEDILTEDPTTGQLASSDVGRFLTEWHERGHQNYFRELRVEQQESPAAQLEHWWDKFQSVLHLHNCLPRGVIGSRLGDFGGGILMSATLAPLRVYREMTGLDYLSEIDQRESITRRYETRFPTTNRKSLAVDLPKFVATNRGDPPDSGANTQSLTQAQRDVRKKYVAAIVRGVATVPGNVLVAMPSYAEAEWIGAQLAEQNNTHDVFIHTPRSEAETKQLRDEFTQSEQAVLTTSIRGTLTEGVDYDGDKLAGCFVVGVPIISTETPAQQAVLAAYTDRWGNTGFRHGVTVPAVRKARQALGRVIRGANDVGVRVLLDGRYCGSQDTQEDGVRDLLSPAEQNEYTPLAGTDEMVTELRKFWANQ